MSKRILQYRIGRRIQRLDPHIAWGAWHDANDDTWQVLNVDQQTTAHAIQARVKPKAKKRNRKANPPA